MLQFLLLKAKNFSLASFFPCPLHCSFSCCSLRRRPPSFSTSPPSCGGGTCPSAAPSIGPSSGSAHWPNLIKACFCQFDFHRHHLPLPSLRSSGRWSTALSGKGQYSRQYGSVNGFFVRPTCLSKRFPLSMSLMVLTNSDLPFSPPFGLILPLLISLIHLLVELSTLAKGGGGREPRWLPPPQSDPRLSGINERSHPVGERTGVGTKYRKL